MPGFRSEKKDLTSYLATDRIVGASTLGACGINIDKNLSLFLCLDTCVFQLPRKEPQFLTEVSESVL